MDETPLVGLRTTVEDLALEILSQTERNVTLDAFEVWEPLDIGDIEPASVLVDVAAAGESDVGVDVAETGETLRLGLVELGVE